MERPTITALAAFLVAGTLLFSIQSVNARPKNAEELVKSMFDAFNRHDVEAMAALYSEDAFIDSPDFDTPKHGPRGIREIYPKYFKQSPDIKDEVGNLVACGNKVFVEFVSSGTISGEKFSLKIATALEVKNGKIIRDVTYFDRLSASK